MQIITIRRILFLILSSVGAFVLGVLLSSQVSANIVQFAPANFYLSYHYQNSISATLKDTCYVVQTHAPLKYTCNIAAPADDYQERDSNPFASPPETSHVWISVLMGENYNKFYDYHTLFKEQKNYELSKRLLDENRKIEFNGAVPLHWNNRDWTFDLTPAKMNFFSYRLGDTVPTYYVYYNNESNGSVQYRYSMNPRWTVGLKTKILHRELVRTEAQLIDLITNFDQTFPVKKQDYLLLEPATTYSWDHEWAPRVSWNFIQWGFANNREAEADMPPYMLFSFGFTPPLEQMYLDFGVTYRYSVRNIYPRQHNLSFGGAAHWGLLELLYSVGNEQNSVGLYAQYWSLRTGVTYEKIYQSVLSNDQQNTNQELMMMELSLVY